MPYQFRFFVNNNAVFQINLQCTKCVAMTEQNKRCQRTVCIGTENSFFTICISSAFKYINLKSL